MKLELQNVNVTVDGISILADQDLSCEAGKITGIIGVSGAGKTTALHCLGLVLRPNAGRVVLDDEDATGWSERQIRNFWRNEASFIFQDYGLIDEESVAYNVGLGLEATKRFRTTCSDKVHCALEKVGLAERGDQIVSHLSGGEKQRVGLARALAKNSSAVFADEPTASLDSRNRAMVIRLLRECADQGATVVVATHDQAMIDSCDRVIELHPQRD